MIYSLIMLTVLVFPFPYNIINPLIGVSDEPKVIEKHGFYRDYECKDYVKNYNLKNRAEKVPYRQAESYNCYLILGEPTK